MNRTQILSKLRKYLGPTAAYEHNPKAPDADERSELRAKARRAGIARTEAKEAMEARRAELLADPEYQRLKAAFKAADETHGSLISKALSYPISVGRGSSHAFHVEFQADTWPEAFAKLEARNART